MSFIFRDQRISSLVFEPALENPNLSKPSGLSGPVEGLLYLDAAQKSFGKQIGGVPAFGHEVVQVNVTPVTGPSSTATETSMMSFNFPTGPGWLMSNTGSLNAAGKTIHLWASGLSNTAGAVSTLTLKVRLGGATGAPPTGTVLLTFAIPVTTAQLTNAVWNLDSYITIQAGNASGGTGTIEAHGWAGTPLAAVSGAVTTVYDVNTTTVTVGDLTTAQLLLVSATLGTASTNVVTQRQQIVEVLQ